MNLAITFAYNELKYIPIWAEYYKKQGCKLYVIDNMSNDGTFEWLVKNGIDCHRFDTNDSFHLTKLQEEAEKTLKKINPEWVIYCGIDLYHITNIGLKNTIDYCNKNGYNQICLPCWGALHTGENDLIPLHKHFFRMAYWKDLIMISKYDESFRMIGDHIHLDNRNIYKAEGISVNYGACKPIAEQEEKLKRREKAWGEGLKNSTGRHFRKGKERNWRYDIKMTQDIRELKEFEYIKQI